MDTGRLERTDDSSTVRGVRTSNETTDAASAMNSLCEVDGSDAGAIGAEGVLRFTQQAGVEQCVPSQPEQQQPLFAPCALAPLELDAAKTPCQARMNPSRRTTAIFTGRDIVVFQSVVLDDQSLRSLPESGARGKSSSLVPREAHTPTSSGGPRTTPPEDPGLT